MIHSNIGHANNGCDTIENTVGKRPVAFRAGGYSVGQWSKIYSVRLAKINESGNKINSVNFGLLSWKKIIILKPKVKISVEEKWR